MNLAQLFPCVIKTQMYFKHHNTKSNLSTYYQTSLNLKILRISFFEILYHIASFLSKIKYHFIQLACVPARVSLSPLSEFSGSVLVFWQHCGNICYRFCHLYLLYRKGEGGFSWAGNKMPRARRKTYHIHRPPS